MNIPLPTTDNLYKFLTAGGITLIGLSVLVGFNHYESVREQKFAAERDAVLAKVNYEQWMSEGVLIDQHYKSLSARLGVILDRFLPVLRSAENIPQSERDQRAKEIATLFEKGGGWARTEVAALIKETYQQIGVELPKLEQQFFENMEREDAELAIKGERFKELAASADVKIGHADVAEKHVKELGKYLCFIIISCSLLASVGFASAVIGFWCWFRKFQKIQDQLLSQQLSGTAN